MGIWPNLLCQVSYETLLHIFTYFEQRMCLGNSKTNNPCFCLAVPILLKVLRSCKIKDSGSIVNRKGLVLIRVTRERRLYMNVGMSRTLCRKMSLLILILSIPSTLTFVELGSRTCELKVAVYELNNSLKQQMWEVAPVSMIQVWWSLLKASFIQITITFVATASIVVSIFICLVKK